MLPKFVALEVWRGTPQPPLSSWALILGSRAPVVTKSLLHVSVNLCLYKVFLHGDSKPVQMTAERQTPFLSPLSFLVFSLHVFPFCSMPPPRPHPHQVTE